MSPGIIVAIAMAGVLLGADEAMAWGPVTHLWYGAQALKDLSGVPPEVRALVTDLRWHYLYGCVAADIIQVKAYTRSIYTHCHSWRVGWQVLDGASSDSERAFAYGYLAHLSHDVFSHNYFVPLQLVTSYPSTVRRHVYWEARFESHFDAADRDLLGEVLAHKSAECDALIERVVERTLFSFRTNKRIFAAVVTLQQLDRWQDTMRRLDAQSRFDLSDATIATFRRLCVQANLEVLAKGEQASVLHLDPTGHDNIRRAREVRRKLRMLRRRGEAVTSLRADIQDSLRPT